MPRFFVKNNQINNDKITIIDEDVKHIKNVLRKQIGDKIEVCNQDTGNSYKCEIEKYFGEGSCHVLKVRKYGGQKVVE